MICPDCKMGPIGPCDVCRRRRVLPGPCASEAEQNAEDMHLSWERDGVQAERELTMARFEESMLRTMQNMIGEPSASDSEDTLASVLATAQRHDPSIVSAEWEDDETIVLRRRDFRGAVKYEP